MSKEREEYMCGACSGSGEGRHDGSSCLSCGGSGAKYEAIECEYCGGTFTTKGRVCSKSCYIGMRDDP